jgi:hypothetical protein
MGFSSLLDAVVLPATAVTIQKDENNAIAQSFAKSDMEAEEVEPQFRSRGTCLILTGTAPHHLQCRFWQRPTNCSLYVQTHKVSPLETPGQ